MRTILWSSLLTCSLATELQLNSAETVTMLVSNGTSFSLPSACQHSFCTQFEILSSAQRKVSVRSSKSDHWVGCSLAFRS